MYFFSSVTLNNLLFKDLDISNVTGLVVACLVIFILTVLFEALKTLKVYFDLRLNENPLARVQNQGSSNMAAGTHDGIILLSSLQFPVSLEQIRNHKITYHLLSTLSHMINFFYGYMLMLVVMSYSLWIFIAVVVGSGLGFFVFGAIGQTLQLRYNQVQSSSKPEDTGPHCHGGQAYPDYASNL